MTNQKNPPPLFDRATSGIWDCGLRIAKGERRKAEGGRQSSEPESAIPNPQSQIRNPRGFTLLEIMVALAVLATGIVSVLELFGGSLRLGGKASQRTQAVIYAQNVMERVLAQERLEDGQESGEFPGGYRWEARVQEIQPPEEEGKRLQSNRQQATDFFHLKEIEVGVFWSEGVGQQSYLLHSLRTQADQPEQPSQ
jgi:general secretion pathway protein I